MVGHHVRTAAGRSLRIVAGVASVVLLAAACSGGDSGGGGGSSAGGSGGPASLGTLSITIAGTSTGNAPLYIAQENGYFAKRGLTVNIINAGSAAFTEAAAGKVDMSMTGTTAGLAPIVQGRQTTMIYAWGVGPDVAGVVVAPNSRYKSLTDLAGQRVSSEGSSGSSYGTTQALSKYVQQKTGKGFQTVALSTLPAQADEVISGRTAAAVGIASIWAPFVAAGKLRLLVDPGKSAEAKTIFGSDLVNLAIWGLPDHLQQKKAAVTAFMGGMLQANAYINGHDDQQVATVLARSPILRGNSVTGLASAFSLDRPFVDSTNGQISRVAWQHSLQEFATWGLGVDPGNPSMGYAKAVDMSYLQAASANS
jgi:ABC-type nitrate/sulfonate/bicarbonate transport system substrate-binding protein